MAKIYCQYWSPEEILNKLQSNEELEIEVQTLESRKRLAVWLAKAVEFDKMAQSNRIAIANSERNIEEVRTYFSFEAEAKKG